ncbi:MAG: rhamnulokinase [Bryobacteraceae bacterium]|nr:rhamnulokinase [Bryobacteraceae bacterium]
MSHYLALDLGAESGRAILGSLSAGKLVLEELHRFSNQPVRLPDGLYWDAFRLFHEIREGLRVAGRGRGLKLSGIGVDTWGVDFGLLDQNGELVANPRHYRDARNNGMMERTFQTVSRAEIFRHTGLQFMQFNSLFQLNAIKQAGSPSLDAASRLLFMPDLLSYWLSGVQKNELTISSTSQFWNPAEARWATELFDALGLPKGLLGDVVLPGTKLGGLLEEIRETSGLGDTPVFATAGHDTASAVAAVPAAGAFSGDEPWCYISSGTWSLMGVELDAPVINARTLELNYTNEVGVDGKVRFLKNIAGLWLVQECRRAWALAGTEYNYVELTQMAAEAPPFASIIDPDAFLEPGSMPERIAAFCVRTGQSAPQNVGSFVRTCLESLAFRYRQVLESLDEVTGRRIGTIHIVGGGSKNGLLNRFVAEATGRTVIAGPGEATAIGNLLVQAMGAGEIDGLKGLRAVVRDSFELERYETKGATPEWDRAYEKYLKIVSARG